MCSKAVATPSPCLPPPSQHTFSLPTMLYPFHATIVPYSLCVPVPLQTALLPTAHPAQLPTCLFVLPICTAMPAWPEHSLSAPDNMFHSLPACACTWHLPTAVNLHYYLSFFVVCFCRGLVPRRRGGGGGGKKGEGGRGNNILLLHCEALSCLPMDILWLGLVGWFSRLELLLLQIPCCMFCLLLALCLIYSLCLPSFPNGTLFCALLHDMPSLETGDCFAFCALLVVCLDMCWDRNKEHCLMEPTQAFCPPPLPTSMLLNFPGRETFPMPVLFSP